MFRKFGKLEKTEIWSGFFLLTTLFFMLFIYAPIELYCYNQDEFWFDIYDLLPILGFLFFVISTFSALILSAIYFGVRKIYYFIVMPALCIFFVCTYIQGNYMVDMIPSMDGLEPDWNSYTTEMIYSAILWVVVTILIIIARMLLDNEKFLKAVKIVSVCMLLMFVITMFSVVVTTKGYEKKLDASCTTKDQYVYSTDENFIIFIVDATDAATLSSIMEEKPEYKTIFEDFTYYENMMGAYPLTETAVPYILSGVWYESEKPILDYAIESFNTSPLLGKLEDEGYKMGMYTFEIPIEDESSFRFSNVLDWKSEISSYTEFIKLEIKLVAYRYAPYQLKKYFLFNTNRFSAVWERNDEYPLYTQENKIFYDRMHSADITTVPEKCFKFIHIDGAHVPFYYDENMNELSNVGTYRDGIKSSVTIVRDYIEKLKEAGVYDNSVIIVMADHGFAEEYYLGAEIEPSVGRQNPIFFVKGIDEHHEMVLSQAPVSYEDLQEAYMRLLDGKDSSKIFDYQEGDYRERRYLRYEFFYDEYMYEYKSTGHASDTDALILTGNKYRTQEY